MQNNCFETQGLLASGTLILEAFMMYWLAVSEVLYNTEYIDAEDQKMKASQQKKHKKKFHLQGLSDMH